MSPARRPWRAHYGRDFWTDESVLLMSFEAAGLYTWLLDHAWEEGSIPDNSAAIAAMCGASTRCSSFKASWAVVRKKWRKDPDNPGRLINRRQEEEREIANGRSRNASESARKRWELNRPLDAAPQKSKPQPTGQRCRKCGGSGDDVSKVKSDVETCPTHGQTVHSVTTTTCRKCGNSGKTTYHRPCLRCAFRANNVNGEDA